MYHRTGATLRRDSNAPKKMKKLISGKKRGLSQEECIELMDEVVSQYKCAGKRIFENGYYQRGRSFRPLDGGHPSNCDVYYLSPQKTIETLCYDTSYHRTLQLIKALKKGKLDTIDTDILNNYVTNGYLTRRGLFADYNDNKIERIKKIAMSHADYMGNESGDSEFDHLRRVEMRN